MRVRCPNCSHPIELVNELDFDQVSCPSCGSSFWLSGSDEDTVTAMFTGRVSALQCFKLLDSIGAGQFGRVCAHHDEELDRIVAVKIPHRQNMDAGDRALVIREAQAVAQAEPPQYRAGLRGRPPGRVPVHRQRVHSGPAAQPLVARCASRMRAKRPSCA